MKIAIACGGTGGHLYPALAIAQKLKKQAGTAIIFLVGEEGLEKEIIGREGYSLFIIKARGLQRKLSYKAFSAPWVTFLGLFQSFWVLLRQRPQVILATGGYLSLPVVLAATFLRIPVLLLEPNAILGFSNRLLLPMVKKVAVAFQQTKELYHEPKMVVTGNPVREGIWNRDKTSAYQKFGLDQKQKTLLVFGGSQGARRINQLILEWMPLLEKENFQVLHIVGERDFTWFSGQIKVNTPRNYQLFSYAFDMAPFYAVADLVICRSGATALAEILACGLPSILVPFPYAAENHQLLNAQILGQKGAAEVLPEKGLTAQTLLEKARNLLNNEKQLASMAQAARSLRKEQATEEVMALLLALAKGEP